MLGEFFTKFKKKLKKMENYRLYSGRFFIFGYFNRGR